MASSVPPFLAISSVLAAAIMMGCVAAGGAPTAARDFIGPEEVEGVEVGNAYELVERLRPLWFRSRGGRSIRLETEIVVYVNGAFIGGIDALREIPIETVGSLRALDAAEAGHLPGLGSRHVERALLVEIRSGP